jgi:3-oxoacyl-[acyl-carrier protein] reductase
MSAFRTAIVTGGGYGIGRAIAQSLASTGWNVVSFDLDGSRNSETLRLIERAGGTAIAVKGSVNEPEDVERACAAAADRFGAITGLVNCAALRYPGPIDMLDIEQWDATIDTCLRGTFLFCRSAIRRMLLSGGGSIVNFSSSSAHGRPNQAAYSAAKAAVETLTYCIALDYRERGIRANAIIPPFTVTGMTENATAEQIALAGARSPLGRAALPTDVAPLAAFLLSAEAAAFTGGNFGSAGLNS